MPTDTRTALLDCAENAARSRGFDGFSYADLSEAVGIRKASIHYHFPTKANLSATLMARYHDAFEAALSATDVAHGTAAGRLRGLISLYRAALSDGKTLCLCVAFITSRESLSDEVHDKIAAFRHMILGWVEAVFALGAQDGTIKGVAHPAQEAQAMVALLEGAQLAARAAEDVTIFDRALQTMLARC